MPEPNPRHDAVSRMKHAEDGLVAMTPGFTMGKYRVLKKRLDGGFWTAYLAEDTVLERKVLIQFPLESHKRTDMTPRFHQQAKMMAKLRHPNIVALHDVGEHNGRPFLAMEYVQGSNLQEILEKDGGLPLLVLLRVIATIAGALQKAHDAGVIHKDIKPRSIIVGTDGEPMLWNFGLASPASGDPLLQEGAAAGTVGYMSPEQWRGPNVPHTSDIWALGVTLYEAIAGHQPFQGETIKELHTQVNESQADLTPIAENAPEFVCEIVKKCLQKNPEDRYASADDLKRALEAAIDYIETSESATMALAPPRQGQTILLNVEYQEADQPGAFRTYEIGERISGGAYGDVYRATEKLSGNPVALKILKHEHVADTDKVVRFRREAMLLARLAHPNIVRVHNFGRYGASFFMAMELLGDSTLADVIREHGPMDVSDATRYLASILTGLATMHEASIVHRDLKPENVAVVRADADTTGDAKTDERVVLFDFGMAHSVDLKTLTMSGQILGTPSYLAPEQARAQAVTGAVDVYASGVILYEALTGSLPHEAETVYHLMEKIAYEEPVPITERRNDLPEGLVKLLASMLAKEPEERPTANSAKWMLGEASAKKA